MDGCYSPKLFVAYATTLSNMARMTKIIITCSISRGVLDLATDSPCGVWCRGWTTCLLHDSPLFGSHKKWELVCKFGVRFHIFMIFIIIFLSRFTVSCTKLVIFLLHSNLFTYQVLCTFIYRRRSLYSFLFHKLGRLNKDFIETRMWLAYQ